MRSLQYIGGKIARSNAPINIDDLNGLNPRLLYPYLDNATDLDPHFIGAYSYGAIVLPAIDPENAIAIAKKGIANNPGEWRLYQQLGYIYWKLGRYEDASRAYEAGSTIPGSATFMKMMAANMQHNGGQRSTARAVYSEMLADTVDESIKVAAQRRLDELDSLDEREAVNVILADVKEKQGQCPRNLREITQQLSAVKLPEDHQFRLDAAGRLADPSGAAYLLDRENCLVRLDPVRSPLYRN
jgi:tetratricopeptide (TPR) repeat protein